GGAARAVEIPTDLRAGNEEIAACVQIGGDERLFGGVEAFIGGRFLARQPDHGRIIAQRDGAIGPSAMVGGVENDSADVLTGNGAKSVISAGRIFSGLKLPSIISIHDKHLRRTADQRAVDSRGPAFSTRADDRNPVIAFLAGSQTIIGVGLDPS